MNEDSVWQTHLSTVHPLLCEITILSGCFGRCDRTVMLGASHDPVLRIDFLRSQWDRSVQPQHFAPGLDHHSPASLADCRAWSLVTTNSSDGSTTSDAASARKIMTAVSWPYEANRGMGAKPMIPNPTMLDDADATKATPVPRAACRRAWYLSGALPNSSRKR